jgi:hypothetical protein
MNTRLFLALAGLMMVASLHAAQSATPPTRPNMLFIVGGDMGYADVGFHGCADIPTLNLDSLAASGVLVETPTTTATSPGRFVDEPVRNCETEARPLC